MVKMFIDAPVETTSTHLEIDTEPIYIPVEEMSDFIIREYEIDLADHGIGQIYLYHDGLQHLKIPFRTYADAVRILIDVVDGRGYKPGSKTVEVLRYLITLTWFSIFNGHITENDLIDNMKAWFRREYASIHSIRPAENEDNDNKTPGEED